MSISPINFVTGEAPAGALTVRDLWVLVVIPIMVAIIAPLILQSVGLIMQRRDKAAANRQTFADLERYVTQRRGRPRTWPWSRRRRSSAGRRHPRP